VAKKDKVAEFLMNDFTTEKWQTAAMKNAYSLLKQQQFNQAAAFFLVAGKLRDCLKLLLKHEKDYLLALTVARLVEGHTQGENYRWVLEVDMHLSLHLFLSRSLARSPTILTTRASVR
jgi:hypothetical protein